MDFNIRIEQVQKIIITQEIQQAINLLQYSAMELNNYIQEEVVNNPVIEVQETDETAEEEKSKKDNGETEKEEQINWDEYFQEDDYNFTPVNLANRDRDREDFSLLDNCSAGSCSLQDHLLAQLRLSNLTAEERSIGEYLIGNIDRYGYLKGDLEEFAEILGVSAERVDAVLAAVQSFDPPGVGARNLSECLLLQLRETDKPVPPHVEEIIKNYLREVAEGRFRQIAERLELSVEQVVEAVNFIRTLDPKPGSHFGDLNDVRYIVPDVVVEKVGKDYVVIVNDGIAPRLTINSFYRSLLYQNQGGAISNYIKTRLNSALWLIRSIEQRRLTLYRVTEEIVRVQRDFFEKGVKSLEPLTLREVAEAIGVHESTVSRATANKYVQTPRGIFPLKFFFSSSVGGSVGKSHSSASIKSHIRELVEQEEQENPLSDQKLVELLQQRGINVSRRTVAKYRKELFIPPSRKRRYLRKDFYLRE